MAVTDYNTDPDQNGTISGINIAEGCNSSDINDAIRQLMADLAVFAASSTAQPGTIQAFAGGSAPSGYLLCDGSAVSRTTYANLFVAIGTAWGAGDGSTTFSLPDYRGKVVVGAGGGYSLAGTGGEAAHTLSSGEVPAVGFSGTASISGTTDAGSPHSHSVSDPGHSHGAPSGFSGAGFNGTVSGAGSSQTTLTTNSATTGISVGNESSHTHSFSGSASVSGSTGGGGGSHNNMQPYAVANVIIKT